jgi:predicted nucleotidyltransferase
MEGSDSARLAPDLRDRLRGLARRTRGLKLLLLFGSRGRGDERADSDWDFAFRGDPSLAVELLSANLAAELATDAVDLVDLDRANGLLRYRAARDGVLLFEARPNSFEQFWLDAVGFWCDARHVLEPSYEAILERTTD